jgi:hypothetical protein
LRQPHGHRASAAEQRISRGPRRAGRDVPTGSLCWIDSLTVTDVFGTATPIPRADAPAGSARTIFSTTDQSTGGTQPFLITPASASASLQASTPLEELHLLRDETADMAWAIERIVENTTGTPPA